MRTCIIDLATGKVTGVVLRGEQEAHPGISEDESPPEGSVWIDHETAGPGWVYDPESKGLSMPKAMLSDIQASWESQKAKAKTVLPKPKVLE